MCLFYKEWQEIYSVWRSKNLVHYFIEGCPDYETLRTYFKDLNEKNPNANGILAIMDDMIEASSVLQHLYTVGSHHMKVSVMTLTQMLFGKSQEYRVVNYNASYLILFKNVRNTRTITTLASQIRPYDVSYIVRAFERASNRPFGYLIFDFTQEQSDVVRLRTAIFKGDGIPITYVKKSARSTL